MSPKGTDLVLTSDIPHGERDVLVFNGLDVESCAQTKVSAQKGNTRSERHTNCWDGGDDFAQLQLVQDCRLTRCVETNLFQYEIWRASRPEEKKGYHEDA